MKIDDLHAVQREDLRTVLTGPGPSLSLVQGPPAIGRTSLLRSVLGTIPPTDAGRLAHRTLPLPPPDQRAAFAATLEREPGIGTFDRDPEPPSANGATDDPDASWRTLLGLVMERADADRRTRIVVLDDAHLLLEGDPEAGEAMEWLWASLREKALPVHVVLSGPSPRLANALRRRAPALLDATDLDLFLEPADLRAVAGGVGAWSPEDRVRAWAVFGGMPGRLAAIDPSASLAANVRRLVLEPGAPLLRAGLAVLAEELQSPARYASILRGLAEGARDWGGLRRACPDFETGSQMAPYLSRLESLGIVAVRRSLDAGERSRNRRYSIRDPFLAFWYRLVLPVLGEVELGDCSGTWARDVRPALDDHVAAVLPAACRRWMIEHGDEVLPERARVSGGLWGEGYDLEVAGTLRNGAPFYGTCSWGSEPASAHDLDEVRARLRCTRYGFGREARHRIVFARGGLSPGALREVARDPWAHGVDLTALLGD